MMRLKRREFTAPNGEKRTFYFREGTNDENTIIATFEEDEYKVLERFQSGDAVIDLGAHIGGVTMLFSVLTSAPKIIAVEPLPENCEIIRKTAKENGVEMVLYEKAIVPISGSKVNVYYGKDVHRFVGQENLTGSEEYAKERDCVAVNTISLKDIFEHDKIRECGFLKVDVEGAEEDLFNTLPGEMLEKIRVIAGEYHNKDFEHFFPYKDRFLINKINYQEFFIERKDARK